MQPFFIKSFKVLNNVWTYSAQGECYKNGTASKKLLDFLTIADVSIQSVQRNENLPTNGQALPTGTTFSVDSVLLERGNHKKISAIHIVSGLPVFNCISTTSGLPLTPITLASAQLYVEPTAQPVIGQTNGDRINQIQTQILTANPRALRVQGLLRNRGNQTLPEFAKSFFEEFNNTSVESGATRNTVYADTDELQTERGKYRSLGDLFMIFRYYYPTCTLKDVTKLLYVTLPTMFTSGFRTDKCQTIQKRVWWYAEGENNNVNRATTADEYGLQVSDWQRLLQ